MKLTLILVLALIMLHSASSQKKNKAHKCNGQYHCERNRTSASCISIDKNLLCDGYSHCPLADDEMNCTCTALTNPTDEKVFHGGFNPGAVSYYTCDIGFELSFNTARTCQLDLSWDGSQPSCISIECSPLDDITFGNVSVTTNRVLGVATYSCITGHTLKGSCERVCLENGSWTGTPSVCLPPVCSQLENPQNGVVSINELSVDGRAKYSCNSEFAIMGTNERVCLKCGVWTGKAPYCLEVPTLSAYGTTFTTAFLTNAFEEEISIIMVSTVDVTVTIESPFLVSDITVTFTDIYKHTFPIGLMHADTTGSEDKGVSISSTKPITVFASNNMFASTDAHLVFPNTILSNNYFVSTFPSLISPLFAEEFVIVGVFDSTVVTIDTPSQSQITINIDSLQSYQHQGIGLSGTQIQASKKIVVISGHACANIPTNSTNYCDYIGDQMVPTERLQKTFIVSFFSPRPSYTVQMISAEDCTVVTIYNSLGNQIETITMNRGDSQIRTYSNNENDIISIIATNGIIVAQYNHGGNRVIGDPSSIIVPGIVQYDNNYIFSTVDNIPTHFVSITMHTAYDFDSLKLDGQSVAGNPTFQITVPELGTYKVMYVQVSAGRHTLAHLNANARYEAIMYGYNRIAEYSFPLGMRL